jgi:uncharacterized damage-inducible protein DinB
MANKQQLLTLYGYNEWANTRIFDAAEKVTSADLSRSAAEGQRNLQALLFHIVRTEWFWRNLIQHKARPAHPPQPEAYPDLAALRAFAQAEAHLGRQLVEQLSEEEIDSVIHVLDRNGQPSALVVWHALLQVLIHGVQHRSEAGLILTHLGQSPGDLDFILFV